MSLTVVFTFVKCQMVGLGISSFTDCSVYACEVSEDIIGYIYWTGTRSMIFSLNDKRLLTFYDTSMRMTIQ